jgi:hypothetical protein
MKDTSLINFGPSGGGVGTSQNFKTAFKYKQGTWNITLVKIIGLTGNLPGTPISTSLPGGLGAPFFDFTSGSCSIQ